VDDKDKFKEASKRNRLAWHAGCKDRFLRAIHGAGRYLPQIEEVFRQQGLPVELTRLPFVESMFNTHAYSRSRASGYWQFMPATWNFLKASIPDLWNKYKMRGSPAIDRRNDPIPASYAAAAYLKYLYEMPPIKSWPLALTSYNQGPGTVITLRKRLDMTKDIAEIVNKGRARRFKHDGRNYYAQFLAVLQLESEADKHFGPLKVAAPITHESITLSAPVSFAGLAEFFKSEKEDGTEMARLYNPFLSRRVVNGKYGIPAGEEIRVPKGTRERFIASLPTLTPIAPKVVVPDEGVHVVRRGENLSIIANEWGVSISAILDANQISRRKLIRPGQKLVIPLPGGPKKNVKEAQHKKEAFHKSSGKSEG
jgi:membrane-bound lytic murein transglycosylase D